MANPIDELIRSDKMYQKELGNTDEYIEVEEGSIDTELKDFGYPSQKEIDQFGFKKLGLLDPVYNDQTGQVEPNGVSFYTKAGYYLASNNLIMSESLIKEINKLDLHKKEDRDKLYVYNSMSHNYDNAIEYMAVDRIHHHCATLQMVLSQNSWKYEALFKTIGNLKDILPGRFRGVNFYMEDFYMYPIEYFYGLCIAAAAHIYQLAINATLQPAANPDFAALTTEDIYSLTNYIVPSLMQMVSVISADLLMFFKLYTLGGRTTYYSALYSENVHTKTEFGEVMDQKIKEASRIDREEFKKKNATKSEFDDDSNYYEF